MQIDFTFVVALVGAAAAVVAAWGCLSLRRDAGEARRRYEDISDELRQLPSSDESLRQLASSEFKHVRDTIEASGNSLSSRQGELATHLVGMQKTVDALQTQLVRELGTSREQQQASFTSMQKGLADSVGELRTGVSGEIARMRDDNATNLERIRQDNAANFGQVRATLDKAREENASSLDKIRSENVASLEKIRADNNTNLAQMRGVVDEKLQKTLNARITESFKLVNDQLDSVSRGLGEMRGMAQNVGDLKRVLSNVKTRGIVGEVQLGAILQEILTVDQYDTNVATVPGSADRVEFAVRIPGADGEFTYLPIDSKFPAETYEHLQDAEAVGSQDAVRAAWRQLESRLDGEAKDIHDKYLAPPATTTFGILFLPFEGLYAEVVNRAGLLERLQVKWHVNVAGPSTMAALLNALQMGFQTVAIQKRADEIQQVLSAVKAELPKYKSELEKAQRQLNTASKTIDNLIGRRTKAMERKLRARSRPCASRAPSES